jgi:hypothetical protein
MLHFLFESMDYTWIFDRPAPTPSIGEATAEHRCPYCHESLVGTRQAMEHILECCDTWRRGYRLSAEPLAREAGEFPVGRGIPTAPVLFSHPGDALIGAERRQAFPNLSVDE